jgi:hypothetical protein
MDVQPVSASLAAPAGRLVAVAALEDNTGAVVVEILPVPALLAEVRHAEEMGHFTAVEPIVLLGDELLPCSEARRFGYVRAIRLCSCDWPARDDRKRLAAVIDDVKKESLTGRPARIAH